MSPTPLSARTDPAEASREDPASGTSRADPELMALVAKGSRQAFLELLERWQGPLHRYFRFSGCGRQGAEDCVQETFLRLYAYRDRYRADRGSFRAFLYRLGRNVAIDSHRRGRRSRGQVPYEEASERELADDDPTPGLGLALDLRAALEQLPERLRAVIQLSVHEGLSHAEIADILAIPLGTVKSRLHHALSRLREALQEARHDA